MVSWTELYSELLDRGVSPLVIRCLIYIYEYQTCNVKWGSSDSRSFNVKNGVRQGAVSSPILFCVYINKIIVKLRESRIGCQLQGVYLGIFVYADDIILLAPSRSALQEMTSICERCTVDLKLKFSTNPNIDKSKTKCIIFSSVLINNDDLLPIMLNGLPLPYVNQIKHLGNILQCENTMKKDCQFKRSKFISKIHSLNQEFHFASTNVMLKLYDIYACSFYGSSLWNLYSNEAEKLYKSWNIAVRILFRLPFDTHRYLIEPISDVPHVKTVLCSRFYSFVNTINTCDKICVRFLANLFQRDLRTVLGNNCINIANECKINVSLVTKQLVKSNQRYANVQVDDEWRVPIIKELILIRSHHLILDDNFDDTDLTNMINHLCSS